MILCPAFQPDPFHIRRRKNAEKSRSLRFIDPFGDTTFNQIQVESLVSEIEAWAKDDSDPGIQRLLDFVNEKRGDVHTYLKFIGD